jgi:hypothetical protein
MVFVPGLFALTIQKTSEPRNGIGGESAPAGDGSLMLPPLL